MGNNRHGTETLCPTYAYKKRKQKRKQTGETMQEKRRETK
jgi:hypothetical protein